ncbi:hypothetical protein BVC80_1495g5 [Macleaya cordata]|uniref:Uncharacterized protein n=1 Tax=Macleaya cordata TaxID=56857 RepID=A0A200PPX6_MACCD|nr:hypothetical protein BVC80_1495g5 [Macleaya cordata]
MAFLLQDGFQIRSNPHTIDKRRRESVAAHTVVDPSHTSWSFDFSRVLNGAEMSDDGFLIQKGPQGPGKDIWHLIPAALF